LNKYNAKKVEIDGITFDSKKEAARYCDLKLMQRAGEIRDLRLQVEYELIPKQAGERACNYIADFVYRDVATGKTIVEDVKGYKKSPSEKKGQMRGKSPFMPCRKSCYE